MSIQVFACDHRKNVDWELPYLRFGGPESDCAIRCKNKIFDLDVNADETPKLFWLWKNLKEFNCDYIGYCQYRRFFGNVKTPLPVLNISAASYRRKFCLDATQQEEVLRNTGADGILHPAFNVLNFQLHPNCKYIWEQIEVLEGSNMFPAEKLEFPFQCFARHTPEYYNGFKLRDAIQYAFEIKENYLCNIFTVKTPLFQLFGEIAFQAAVDTAQSLTANEKSKLHPYWLAYLFERFTSVFYHALEYSGKYTFLKFPLITIDAHTHIKKAVQYDKLERLF